ncbi:hypothetical protein I1A_000716 [Pseudomonas fluorescens R124]|uniref:KilA/APSES-type HTH DNA-binding domain-containing protein n=1 Tax=Pseudomonas fluorescens R124 TaxID=743713 RepID=A0A7U9GQU7_PSEFL|nr:KilA-N domain-containing protein [Pseudomonas fluorescens]EJZ56408.1 hypothetical protein I1A_000716 [Pseudomonas fluorescens R124]
MLHNSLPIILIDEAGNKQVFSPDNSGMYNLTAMHRDLGLRASKSPSQWDNTIKRHLSNSGNFLSIEGKGGGTFATEAACIAYAMWVSPEFYLMVVATFIAVRNDEKLAAQAHRKLSSEYQEMFSNNCRKLKAYDRFDKLHKQGWLNACYLAGINYPRKAHDYVFEQYMFWSVRYTGNRTDYRVTQAGWNAGFDTRRRGNYGEELAVTKLARNWLLEHADEINAATSQKVARRHA